MRKTSLIKIEKKATTISKQLIGELFLVKDLNDVIAFTQTYISNYLPVLFYAVKHLDKNQIAEIMNSSILIDRLLSIRIDDIVRFQVSTGVRDFLEVNSSTDRDSIAKLYNSLTSINKANLSSSLLFLFSFMRGSMFALYCNNKMYLNFGIGWNNLLSHFLFCPHLIFTLDKNDLKLAEEQLDFLESDLKTINGKLETEINTALKETGICTTDSECASIDKYFVGLKFEWLKSKSLVSYCKFLKSNDKEQLKHAIKYCNIILESLESEDTSYHSLSFRDKLSFPGPSADIKNLIGDLKQYTRIIKLFNYGAYFESANAKFVMLFPTSTEFYFNHNIVNKDRISILADEEFLIQLHQKGCFAILNFCDILVKPSQSAYRDQIQDYLLIFNEFLKSGISNKFIYGQLRNSEIKDLIIKKFEKTIDKTKAAANVMGISIISAFNYFAEARGLQQIPAYVNITIPLVTEIVMQAIYKSGYDRLLTEMSAEKEDGSNFLGSSNDDEYQSITQLEKQISCLEESTGELLNYVKLDGLKEIFEMNNHIMTLIKSTKSVEEINEELHKLYVDTKD